jgi:hypothetical protein
MIRSDRITSFVMPGLDPGIHAFVFQGKKDVDCRVKPGNDDRVMAQSKRIML